MRSLRLSLLVLTALSGSAFAQLHDSGPMGPGASGAPTPDAAVRSAIHLPDMATPLAVSPSVTTRGRFSAARKQRAHDRWSQMKALTQRISDESKAGRLYSHKAESLRGELAAIQEKYRFRLEMEGMALSKAQALSLQGELDSLDLNITASLNPSPSQP